jgi:hypothetical protein
VSSKLLNLFHARSLTVKANIIDKVYLMGRKVGDGFKKSMRILFDDHLGHWNYVAVSQHG